MPSKLTLLTLLTLLAILSLLIPVHAQEKERDLSTELQILSDTVGTWDCAITVWPAGLEAAPITMKGVETNEAFGNHWLSSGFSSEFQGQEMKVHTIVGYDLDLKKFVGTVIDHGPYAAKMKGKFDKETKTIHWTTQAKTPDGQPMIQKTSVTHTSATERHLVMKMQNPSTGKFGKFMEINYTKRK